jgi:hypothetical protein
LAETTVRPARRRTTITDEQNEQTDRFVMVSTRHLVRVGSLGHVGRFAAIDHTRYPRRCRVICRTARGLEVGEILATIGDDGPLDGDVIRRVTVQDELLLERIERRQQEAFRACSQLLASHGVPAVLMDVEHLFDGQSLFFYFLGEVDERVERLTGELADVYEARVQFRKFTESLMQGCGPECGTESAAGGCGDAGCSSCAVAAACGTRRRA